MKHINAVLKGDERRQFRKDVFRGPFEKVKEIIETLNIDVNSPMDIDRNDTMLMICIEGTKYGKDNYRLASYLLEKGTNPNIQDKNGNSPFHMAIYQKNFELIELMLNYDIDVNQKAEGGYTTLFAFIHSVYRVVASLGIPIKKRSLAIIEEMLKRGADVDTRSSYGSTARNSYFNEMARLFWL